MKKIIKKIGIEDLDAIYELRMASLKEDSFAFGTDVTDVQKEEIANVLKANQDSNAIYGGYVDGKLVGMLGLTREVGKKKKHKAIVWGMFIFAEYRGIGLGGDLLDFAIKEGRRQKIVILNLTTEAYNEKAVRLYKTRGFVMWGIEKQGLFIDGCYHDQGYMSLILEETPHV